jgi:excinuclease ABC subunit A
MLEHYHIDKDKPIKKLSKREIHLMMWGSDEPIKVVAKSESHKTYVFNDYIEGVLATIKRRHLETNS